MEDIGLFQDHEVISQDEACVRLVKEGSGGHFLICFLSLLIMRILEHETGNEYTTRSLTQSLRNATLGEMAPGVYVTLYYDRVLMNLNRRMNLDAKQMVYTQKDIQKLIVRTKKDT